MSFNILIVDDSSVTRAVLKKTILMTEFPVNTIAQATNGFEALELMKSQSIDIVLTDLNMPEMNGIEMFEHMKEDPHTADIPLVVISTEASASRINELKSQGMRGYIHKPFTAENVRDILSSILGMSTV